MCFIKEMSTNIIGRVFCNQMAHISSSISLFHDHDDDGLVLVVDGPGNQKKNSTISCAPSAAAAEATPSRGRTATTSCNTTMTMVRPDRLSLKILRILNRELFRNDDPAYLKNLTHDPFEARASSTAAVMTATAAARTIMPKNRIISLRHSQEPTITVISTRKSQHCSCYPLLAQLVMRFMFILIVLPVLLPSLSTSSSLYYSSCVEATVLIGNQTYPSLPGLFGRFMQEGQTYHGRIQFLPENPYLCDSFNPNHTSFVIPATATIPTADKVNLTIRDAVVLLAIRGNCPFQRKANVAESMDHSILYLIVYNYNLEGDDTLVPMYSEYGNTRLYLLSITHKAGKEIREYILNQPKHIHENGGPFIEMNSNPPPGLLTADDLQQIMLSALGLFFMLVSFSGCLMILLGTYGQLQLQQHQQQYGTTTAGEDGTTTPTNGSITGSFPRTLRTLLTLEEVERLSNLPLANHSSSNRQAQQTNNDNSINGQQATTASGTDSSSSVFLQDNSCAICIDDFHSNGRSITTTLPCGHVFHTSCIGPWLTERQSKCPLCKFDVLLYLLDYESQQRTQQQQQQRSHQQQQRQSGIPNDDDDNDNIGSGTSPGQGDRGGGGDGYGLYGWMTMLVQQHRLRQYTNWMQVDQRVQQQDWEDQEEEEEHQDDDQPNVRSGTRVSTMTTIPTTTATTTTTTTSSSNRRTNRSYDPGEVEMTQ